MSSSWDPGESFLLLANSVSGGREGGSTGAIPSKREKALEKENEELKLVVAELTLANRLQIH